MFNQKWCGSGHEQNIIGIIYLHSRIHGTACTVGWWGIFSSSREPVDGFDIIGESDNIAGKDQEQSNDAEDADSIESDKGVLKLRGHHINEFNK